MHGPLNVKIVSSYFSSKQCTFVPTQNKPYSTQNFNYTFPIKHLIDKG